VWVVIVVSALTLAAGSVAQAATTALTADPDTLTVKLAGSDKSVTVNVQFNADQPFDASVEPYAPPLRLATTDGVQFSENPISLKPSIDPDRRGLSLPIVLTRTESLDAGRYEGTVVVRAGTVTGRSTLVVQVDVVPRDGRETWSLAILAIVIGAAGGALLKWLTEVGSKLSALSNRLTQVSALLQTLGEYVPLSLQGLLLQSRIALGQREAQTAETLLNTITQEKLTGVVAASDQLRKLDREIDDLRELIGKRGLSDAERRSLEEVLQQARHELREALEQIWPDPTSGQVNRNALADGASMFSVFVERYTAPSRLGENDVKAALQLFQDGEWAKAREAMAKVGPAALGGAPPPPSPPPVATALPKPGRLDRLTAWLIRHYALIAQILVVVGLLFLFDRDTAFTTDAGEEWLKLLAWGFGAQATGVTIAQLGGKMIGAGPKFD
jgi:hypothetical protein